MTEQEYLDRYVRRIAAQSGWSEQQARGYVTGAGLSYAELSEGFEDDPEGAADEEMSYWEAD